MENFSRRKFIQNVSLGLGAVTIGGPQVFTAAKDTELPAATDDAPMADGDKTTADILVEKLIAWNVEVIFCVVGDGINYIIEALRKNQDKIRLITVRHEEAAAFMASSYAKYTGKLGVCIATTGPGAVHLMNGLYDAAMENAPVLAITGLPFHDLIGTHFTQEVDTISLMKDVAVYNMTITGPVHARTVVDLACRAAMGMPGVAHLTISKDTQHKKLSDDKPSKDSGNLRGSAVFAPIMEAPSDDELNMAAKVLNASSKITILAGRGALHASAEVEMIADKLGAPVAKALLGKALLPDDSPFTTGGTGHLGTMPSKDMMKSCDTFLILGSNMPHLEYYPDHGTVNCIQIDRDARRIGLRYPVTLGLTGDIKATLNALLPKLQYHSDRSFLQTAQGKMKDWNAKLRTIEKQRSEPVKPQFLVAEASRLIDDNAVIAIDTGAHTQFTARHLQVRKDQKIAVSGNLATMAPGLPYAIAAQIAYPGRQCVAFVGDGGFTMLMGEMATAVRYNLPVKVIIFKNNALAMDRFEQEEMGNKDYGIDLQPIDFVKIAEACGAEAYSCKTAEEVTHNLKKAFASPNPVLIEVSVDPNEPPVPPDKV